MATKSTMFTAATMPNAKADAQAMVPYTANLAGRDGNCIDSLRRANSPIIARLFVAGMGEFTNNAG
jgi:hypothetical protein